MLAKFSIIRLHHSTTYIDAASCYRPISMVCLSVCLSVTVVSAAKRLNRLRCRLGCGFE